MAEPTIQSAQRLFDHPEIDLLVVTGGPGVVREAMKSGKKAIFVFEVEDPETALALGGRGVELIETFVLVELQKGLQRIGKT